MVAKIKLRRLTSTFRVRLCMYVFKYTVYPALSHQCVIRPLIKRHQGYFMDNEAHLSSRTWPQVIRGEPLHLTELVDGDFPTGETQRRQPWSGNQFDKQTLSETRTSCIISASAGPWDGPGGGARREGGGSSLLRTRAPCRSSGYYSARWGSGRLSAVFLQEALRYLPQDDHQWWETSKRPPGELKPGAHHDRTSAAVRPPVGVSLISFWPGDPEVSIQRSTSANSHSRSGDVTEEAQLDAMATEILKSNGRPHICVPLQPLVPGLAQFICETSRDCDFMETVVSEQPGLDMEELYNRYCSSHRLLFIKKLPEDVFDINNQENLLSVFKPADKTPERLHQTLPGGVTSAAQGDFNPYGSGELLLGPVLHQPKEQHEGTGGSVSCSGRRVTTATLWLLQVRNAPVSYIFFLSSF